MMKTVQSKPWIRHKTMIELKYRARAFYMPSHVFIITHGDVHIQILLISCSRNFFAVF